MGAPGSDLGASRCFDHELRLWRRNEGRWNIRPKIDALRADLDEDLWFGSGLALAEMDSQYILPPSSGWSSQD